MNSDTAGWIRARLSSLGTLYCGQSSSASEVNIVGVGTPYITGPEHWDGHNLILNKWTTHPKRVVPNDCIFITVKGAGVGKIFPGVASAIGRDVYAFKPNDDVSPRFVEHALRFTVQDILGHAVGDIPGISKSHILEHEISIPLDRIEQDRIIAEIEKQFSRLDEAVANLKRVKANLKRYKAAVLKAAVEGRLVETEAELARREGRSYETGAELLQRILETRRSRWKGKGKYKEPAAPDTADLPDLPEGWVWATVEQISKLVEYGSSAKTNEEANGIPVLRMGNIVEGELHYEILKYLPLDHYEFPKLFLKPGDILFNRTNSPELVGKTAVFSGFPQRCSFASYLIRVRLVDGPQPKLIAAYINSSYGRNWVKSVVTQQVGQANVNGTKLQALAIPLLPEDEQHRIVAEVDRRLSLLRETQIQVDANLRRADRLRQSILSRAFSGRLLNATEPIPDVTPSWPMAAEEPADYRAHP